MSNAGETPSPSPSSAPSRRGRFPWTATLPLLFVAGVWLFRLVTGGGIAASPEPFDVEAYLKETIPDGSNAYPLYEEARKALVNPPAPLNMGRRVAPWSQADDLLRAWAEKNRPALHLWLEGTARPDFLPPSNPAEPVPPTFAFHNYISLARFAALEASRLSDEGQHAEAWEMQKGRLRMRLHATRHCCYIQRYFESFNFADVVSETLAWAETPGVDEATLRRALADAQALEALLPNESETLRREYLYILWSLNQPDQLRVALQQLTTPPGGQPASGVYLTGPFARAKDFLSGEPARSRAAARLAFANWLPQADLPASARAPVVSPDPLVFSAPNADAVAAACGKPSYYSVLRGAFNAKSMPRLDDWPTRLGAERKSVANLVIGLANKLYEVKTGKFPDDPKQLVGPILKALPEGYKDLELTEPEAPAKP